MSLTVVLYPIQMMLKKEKSINHIEVPFTLSLKKKKKRKKENPNAVVRWSVNCFL